MELGNIPCFVMAALEYSTRNPRGVFKSSGTEETKNHLTVNEMASNIFLLKEKPKNSKEWFVGARFCWFFPVYELCAFYWWMQQEAINGTEGRSTEGWHVSKILEKGEVAARRRAQTWGSAAAQGWSGFGSSQVQCVCCATNGGKILWCYSMHRNQLQKSGCVPVRT